MPSPKSNRSETHRRRRSSSFHGQSGMPVGQLRRPKTVSDLSSMRNLSGTVPEGLPRQPPKMLLKVMMLRSLAPVHILMTPDSTVSDLIAAAVRLYIKESRRPKLPSNESSDFDLHYSQFSLERLERKQKVVELGSRNFFLCPRKRGTATATSSCAKEAEMLRDGCGTGTGTGGFAWFKLMQFMM